MVSAVLADALSNPLDVLYSVDPSPATHETGAGYTTRVASVFRAIFKKEDAFRQISALDASHPPESYADQYHPLVRFRAMVQDTSISPELYPSVLPDGKPGGWGLAEAGQPEGSLDVHNLKEREVVWAVSVPGESPFIAELLDDADEPSSKQDIGPNPFRYKDPLSREKHVGIQVKVYDTSAPPLKPTELRTFVGFLSFEHATSIEDTTADRPLPTLHVLFSTEHVSSIIRFPYPLSPVSEVDDAFVPVSTVRDDLIRWISDEALGGDVDAAEWVLMAAIAGVQSRNPPLLPPSLTISRFPEAEHNTTPALVHVLRNILPLFVDVTLSLAMLNSLPFMPESRDESLRSGLLQLPAGTTLLVSESGIEEGKITETGVGNIQALRSAVVAQTLDYQFPFSTHYQFPTDFSFVFLTERRKCTLLETVLNVPLQCKTPAECYKAIEKITLPSPARLEAFRRLVGGAKTGKIRVTEEMSQYIQEDFVHERQANKAVTPDDLMMRMSVARLMALSYHDDELSKDIWHKTKELDGRRRQRLSGLIGT